MPGQYVDLTPDERQGFAHTEFGQMQWVRTIRYFNVSERMEMLAYIADCVQAGDVTSIKLSFTADNEYRLVVKQDRHGPAVVMPS